MDKLTQLPPAVMDMIEKIRSDSENTNYRENLAGRLETIAEVCKSEADRFRRRRDQDQRWRSR